MVSDTSFNSITSSNKQADQSIGSSHRNFVESNDVERRKRWNFQLNPALLNQGMKTVLESFC